MFRVFTPDSPESQAQLASSIPRLSRRQTLFTYRPMRTTHTFATPAVVAAILTLTACASTIQKPTTPEAAAAVRKSTLQVYADNSVTFLSKQLYSWPSKGSEASGKFIALEADGKAYNAKGIKSVKTLSGGVISGKMTYKAAITMADDTKVFAPTDTLHWLACDRNKDCELIENQSADLMTGTHPEIAKTPRRNFRSKMYEDPSSSYKKGLAALPELKQDGPDAFEVANEKDSQWWNTVRVQNEKWYQTNGQAQNDDQSKKFAAADRAGEDARARVKGSANEKVGVNVFCQDNASNQADLPGHVRINCQGLGPTSLDEMHSLGWRVANMQVRSGPNQFNNMTEYVHDITLQKVR